MVSKNIRKTFISYLKGFEPPTHGLEGRCSIRLSYRYISSLSTLTFII